MITNSWPNKGTEYLLLWNFWRKFDCLSSNYEVKQYIHLHWVDGLDWNYLCVFVWRMNYLCQLVQLSELMTMFWSHTAKIPLYLYPLLNTTTIEMPFELLRVGSLAVIGGLLKVFALIILPLQYMLSSDIIHLRNSFYSIVIWPLKVSCVLPCPLEVVNAIRRYIVISNLVLPFNLGIRLCFT